MQAGDTEQYVRLKKRKEKVGDTEQRSLKGLCVGKSKREPKDGT